MFLTLRLMLDPLAQFLRAQQGVVLVDLQGHGSLELRVEHLAQYTKEFRGRHQDQLPKAAFLMAAKKERATSLAKICVWCSAGD